MNPKLQELVEEAVAFKSPEELALGYLRYEALRRVLPSKYKEMHELCIRGKWFDDQVDGLVCEDTTRGGAR